MPEVYLPRQARSLSAGGRPAARSRFSERRNGRTAEWRNGRTAERRNGRTAERQTPVPNTPHPVPRTPHLVLRTFDPLLVVAPTPLIFSGQSYIHNIH
jgi:hypothetical protein